MNAEALKSIYALEERCRQLLQDINLFLHIQGEARVQRPIDEIIGTIEHHYRIPPGSLRETNRTMPIVEARLVAYYLIRTMTQMTYQQIGQEMGKHHRSVMCGERRVRELLDVDPGFRAKVDALTKQLTEKNEAA